MSSCGNRGKENEGRDTFERIQGNILGPKKRLHRDFPGGAVVKNLLANAGDTGSSPGSGRSHMPRSMPLHHIC